MTQSQLDRQQRKSRLKEFRRNALVAYDRDLKDARETGKPVVWAYSMLPQEILRTMDVAVFYPELEASNATAAGQSGEFCELAEERGEFSRDLCSLLKQAIGFAYKGERSKGRFLPAPDMLIGEGAQCDAFGKAWEIIARHFNVPYLRLDGPFHLDGPIMEHELEWSVAETKRLIAFLEENTGRRLDMDRLREALQYGVQASELVQQVLQYKKGIPEPRGVFDSLRDWSYLIVSLGLRENVEYWSLVLDDIKDTLAEGTGAVPNERFRLWYDNNMPYHMLEWFEYLERHGAVNAIETNWFNFGYGGMYFNGHTIDPDKPFETLALRRFYMWVNSGPPARLRWATRAIKEWHVDGAIIPNNPSCKLYAHSVYEQARIFQDKCGIPALILNFDPLDERDVDKRRIYRDTDQFLEVLESSKATRGI